MQFLKMDEVGAKNVEKLCSNEKNGTSAIFDSCGNPSDSVAKNIENINVRDSDSKKESSYNLDTFDVSSNTAAGFLVRNERNITADAANVSFIAVAADGIGNGSGEDEFDEKEKADATPENLKKIDDAISGNYVNECSKQTGEELKIIEDESSTKQNFAFTIDFGSNESTSATTVAKYKNIMERFQNRHKRGASFSKLEGQQNTGNNSTKTVGKSTSTISSSSTTIMQGRQPRSECLESDKVKLRIRHRSTSGVRDSNKRHSWSPRSSTHEILDTLKIEKQSSSKLSVNNVNKNLPVICKQDSAEVNLDHVIRSIESTSSTTGASMMHKCGIQYFKDEQKSNFTPRSTAMQIALNKFEFICPEPPLELKHLSGDGDGDTVSEAGTYTLDGDNYTEEQKELMNIDKTINYKLQIGNSQNSVNDLTQIRPSDLPLMCTLSSENRRRNNVLEVNYYQDSTNIKPKVSYLEKIKSRVKSITKSPDKKKNLSTDIGSFTSVTTSGILSKKPTLDANPRIGRRNSLTKSQVDNSEYVSANKRVTCPSTYTDHQKAEYKLNLFGNQSEYIIESSPDTPVSSNNNYMKLNKIDTGLKSAQSKNDWIQEWARNARARSMSTTTKDFGNQICNADEPDFTDSYSHHSNEKMNKHRVRDAEYLSDTNISDRKTGNNDIFMSCRPPLSPSRIPSPMHSAGKMRNSNRNRDSVLDFSPLIPADPETEVYLRKTAAAISHLTQSLSRKNSLQSCKSLSSTNESPRRMFHHHYSADEYSPPHKSRNDVHKRNLSLDYQTNIMSQSLSNEILNGYLDYRNRQRSRQNSVDGNLSSPNRNSRQAIIDQTQSIKHVFSQSPLKRSNSFSVKPMSTSTTHKNATINKNIQRCVTISKGTVTMVNKNPIQKSASSTSFRKMYNDYDDNVAYYINDEDDLVDNYCSSEEMEDNERYIEQEIEIEPEPELHTTRYNKALLMRIERSKQKVAGMTQMKSTSAGVMACPNTPEMPRRTAQNVARLSMRQSVPRDSSLNRLRGEIPSSLASAKTQLLQTANSVGITKKVQPKYMDISKYKSNQAVNFLKKDESKSTLTNKSEVKRSPSSASVVLNRTDAFRTSNRSIKSAGNKPTNSRRDTSISKQKEVELAMWKRRATYDPLKAAAEGRRKQEEAKKLAQAQTKPGNKPPKSPSRRNL